MAYEKRRNFRADVKGYAEFLKYLRWKPLISVGIVIVIWAACRHEAARNRNPFKAIMVHRAVTIGVITPMPPQTFTVIRGKTTVWTLDTNCYGYTMKIVTPGANVTSTTYLGTPQHFNSDTLTGTQSTGPLYFGPVEVTLDDDSKVNEATIELTLIRYSK